MEVKAVSRNVRVASSKARLLVDLVRGKKVDEALDILRFTPTPTAQAVAKTIKSAAANAENVFQMSTSDLRIVKIFADEGKMMRRFQPRSRGRVSPILKRSSHITVVVAEQED